MTDGRYGFIPNLHILLDGDEARAGSYLPFGMEQVRKLIRTGLFSTQNNLVLNDGTRIHAKVVGEQRYLRIESPPPCELYLESGIVNVGSIGPANPAFNDDGKLYLNPTLSAMPELNGLLKLPLTTEEDSKPISGDTAESFKKKSETDEHGNVTVDQASLTELQRKKLTVATVPPSLFTGKTRLYVQAIYGRRLKSFTRWSMNLSFQPAALRYSGRSNGEDYIVDISTNSGIYTSENYDYFLLQVMGGGSQYVTVRKLVAESACVEAARAYLSRNKDRLSDDKKAAMEAYVLSGSYPSEEIKFNLDAVIETNWQLGYGWHFNWSGTACDIVKIDTINTGGSTYKHKSTHYRMEFARDKDKAIPISDPPLTPAQQERMRWAAVKQSTVEEVEWKHSKWQHVIAYPDWTAGQLQIFGALFGNRFGDGAPLYCFYRGDDLQVARFSLSGGESVTMNSRTSSPSLAYGVIGWVTCTPPPVTMKALGLGGASGGDFTRLSMPINVGVSIGGINVSGSSQSYSGNVEEWSSKSRNGSDVYYAPATQSSVTLPYGEAAPKVVTQGAGECALSVWDVNSLGHPTITLGSGVYESSNTIGATGNYNSFVRTQAETMSILFVIPFYDAEAVYLWGEREDYTSDSGSSNSLEFTLSQLISIVKKDGGEVAVAEEYAEVTDTGYSITSTTAYSSVSSVLTPAGFYLVNGEGEHNLPGAPPGLSAFFAGEPTTHVAQTFTTHTSALRDATRGQSLPITGGYSNDGHVFVGHA